MINDYSLGYGTALYKLAEETGSSKEIFDDFRFVGDVFSTQPQLGRLLSNPRLTASERADVIQSIFGGRINGYLNNMLKLLAEKRRCDIIHKCLSVYQNHYCEANNILAVTAFSSVALTNDQKQRLIETLRKKTGCDIILETKLDKSCIGGMRVEYGGKRFDSSVKNKLDSMKKSLKSKY